MTTSGLSDCLTFPLLLIQSTVLFSSEMCQQILEETRPRYCTCRTQRMDPSNSGWSQGFLSGAPGKSYIYSKISQYLVNPFPPILDISLRCHQKFDICSLEWHIWQGFLAGLRLRYLLNTSVSHKHHRTHLFSHSLSWSRSPPGSSSAKEIKHENSRMTWNVKSDQTVWSRKCRACIRYTVI